MARCSSSLRVSSSRRPSRSPNRTPPDVVRVVIKLRRKYPALELLLTEDQTDRIYERLMDGELDLLLLALPASGKSEAPSPNF